MPITVTKEMIDLGDSGVPLTVQLNYNRVTKIGQMFHLNLDYSSVEALN